jgi:surfeit locus 1 family protein
VTAKCAPARGCLPPAFPGVTAIVRIGSRALRLSLPWLLASLAGMAAFVALGRWQWHRADERRAQFAAFAASSVSAGEALGTRSLAQLPRYAPVQLAGRYDGAHQFLLDNISRDGRAGYEVLTPLRLEDRRVVMVNRGWLPLVGGERQQLPDVTLPDAGPVAVSGRADHLPAAGLQLGRSAPSGSGSWPRLSSFPTSQELAAALGTAVEPGQILLAAGAANGFRRDWQPVNSGFPPERHVAYAVQWWSLAALCAILYVVMTVRANR